VLAAPNVLEALREHHAPLYVISHGRLVDRAKMERSHGLENGRRYRSPRNHKPSDT